MRTGRGVTAVVVPRHKQGARYAACAPLCEPSRAGTDRGLPRTTPRRTPASGRPPSPSAVPQHLHLGARPVRDGRDQHGHAPGAHRRVHAGLLRDALHARARSRGRRAPRRSPGRPPPHRPTRRPARRRRPRPAPLGHATAAPSAGVRRPPAPARRPRPRSARAVPTGSSRAPQGKDQANVDLRRRAPSGSPPSPGPRPGTAGCAGPAPVPAAAAHPPPDQCTSRQIRVARPVPHDLRARPGRGRSRRAVRPRWPSRPPGTRTRCGSRLRLRRVGDPPAPHRRVVHPRHQQPVRLRRPPETARTAHLLGRDELGQTIGDRSPIPAPRAPRSSLALGARRPAARPGRRTRRAGRRGRGGGRSPVRERRSSRAVPARSSAMKSRPDKAKEASSTAASVA